MHSSGSSMPKHFGPDGLMRQQIRHKALAGQQGLSLIELVVALAVISIIAAMAIPSWIRIQKNARLNRDAHNLASTLSVAKMRAAADFTEARVLLFTGTDKTP